MLPKFVGTGVAFLLVVASAGAQDPEMVRKKLDVARSNYQTDLDKYRAAVKKWFDAREDAARKAGSIKLVEQIKEEREAFEMKAELPATVPVQLKQQLAAARVTMVNAYQAAIKGYLQARMDDKAAEIQKELDEFKKEIEVAAPMPMPPASDVLRKGTILAGTRQVTGEDRPIPVEVVITERDREAFKGEMKLHMPRGAPAVFQVAGTAATSKDGAIRFKSEKKGKAVWEFVGQFTNGQAEFKVNAVGPRGRPLEGKARLAPK